MYRFSVILLLLCYSLVSNSQALFNPKSKIDLQLDKQGKPFFVLKIVNNSGFQGVPQLVKQSGKEILKFNGLDPAKPKFGSTLKVPISTDILLKVQPTGAAKAKYAFLVPVEYKVKKGETLYKLAKVINNEEVASFSKRNQIKNNDIKVGSIVTLGWLPIEKSKEEKKLIEKKETTSLLKKEDIKDKGKVVLDPKKSKDALSLASKTKSQDTMRRVILTPEEELKRQQEELKWISNKGIAIWQHSHRKNSHKFVLHNKAPLNSVIHLYNPMAKKSITAKVIGRIPSETYPNDVDLVISSGAASSLGALDNRFMVEMKYKN